ncbi:branched-chain amino acid ABC transporter permease, partial [Meiothermus luteus]|uniref:branched-chain amino acid ABC transporter permease n=1 Tax=Meiothermus luteus TaxID=2026184 RepID=UPI0011C3B665
MDLALNLQTALNGLANGALYAVIAAGFVLVYRATSVVNFAIAEFLLIGAYLTYTFSLFFSLLPAILLALPLAFAFGVLVERVFVRPLLGRNVVAVIMATIGLASALDGATLLIWGPDQKAMGTADAFQLPKEVPNLALRLGEVFLSSKAVWSLILALPLALLLIAMLKYSRYGILLRAISESETAALALGINAPRVVAVAWGISAVMATVGGAFLA